MSGLVAASVLRICETNASKRALDRIRMRHAAASVRLTQAV
jgi:hypothetical protein